MRAFCIAAGTVLFAAVSLFGQGYRPYGYANRSGFGSVLFPGTGGPPPLRNPFSITDPGFAARLGGNVSGFRPYRGGRGGYGGAVYAVPVPVIVGGYGYYDPSGYDQPPAQYAPPPVQQVPSITIVMPPNSAAPAVYQPEQPVQPSMREYGPDDYGKTEPGSNVRVYQVPERQQPAPPADEPIMFLIALKDNSIYTASAYWVEGDTLHYITTRGEHNQVSLDLVDRETSARLNRGRKAEFRLPPPKQ